MHKIFELTLLVVALFVFSNEAADPTSYPGKPCADSESDSNCENSVSGLKCVENQCACADGRVFYYGDLNKCVIPYNESCTETEIDLTPNSECHEKKVICKTGFVFTSAGRCIASPESECNDNTGCDEDKFLICTTGAPRICKCPPGTEISGDGECKLKLNEVCQNAPFPVVQCEKLTQCNDGMCQCNDGLEENENGQCRARYDDDCSGGDDTPCDEAKFQECTDDEKKCKCDGEGSLTWYNPKTETCDLFLGGDCKNTTNKPKCTVSDFIECRVDGENSICACKTETGPDDQGLVPSNDSKNCFASFDKSCSETDETKAVCNTDMFYKCVDDKCACGAGAGFNSSSEVCVLLVGSACEYEVEKQPCVARSRCQKEKCVCNPNFVKDPESHCKLKYGATCDAAYDECNVLKFEKCNAYRGKGYCECEGKDDMLIRNGICTIKAGKACEAAEGKAKCVDFATCRSSVCECAPGLTTNFFGDCVGDYRAPCGYEGQPVCNTEAFLECKGDTRKTCACEQPGGASYAWYNAKSKKCEFHIGSVCGAAQKCSSLPGVECRVTSNPFYKTCQCLAGQDLIPSNNRTQCYEAYGNDCNARNDSFIKCSPDHFYVCEESKCVCAGGSSLENFSKMCKLLAGEECKTGENEQPCGARSSCKPEAGGDPAKGTCVCDHGHGYLKNSAGLCKLVFGSKCDAANDECNALGFEKCGAIFGICECESDDLIYIEGGCRIKAYRPCDVFWGPVCVPNASCEEEANDLPNSGVTQTVCKCQTGLVPNSKGECVAEYGSPCGEYRFDECNSESFLECNATLTCSCSQPDKTWYNPRSETCELLAGEKCETSRGSQSCTEFSSCRQNRPGGSFLCECLHGFITSPNGRCVPSYGAP